MWAGVESVWLVLGDFRCTPRYDPVQRHARANNCEKSRIGLADEWMGGSSKQDTLSGDTSGTRGQDTPAYKYKYLMPLAKLVLQGHKGVPWRQRI